MPPWDKYQNTEPAPAGPWAKYSQPAAPEEGPSMLGRGLQFVGRQMSRVPAAVRGATEAYQTNNAHSAANRALQGFLEPESVQSSSEMMGRFGADTAQTKMQVRTPPPGANFNFQTMDFTPQKADTTYTSQAQELGDAFDAVAPTGLEVIPGAMALKSRAAGAVFKGGEKVSNLANKAAGKLAQELSSVSEEALRMASTKEGRAALKANAGKEYEIGQRLVHMMDNPETYSANKAKVDKAIAGMGDVDLMPVIKALQEAKVKRPSGKLFPHEQAANDAIQKDINALLGQGGKTKVTAAEALDLRRGMDKAIDFKAPEGRLLDNAKKKGRLALKNLLEDKATLSRNPEYIEGMATWSKQLDAKDRLESFLGKNKGAQEDRAEAFISNLWGKNKKNRQKIMDDIGEVFGPDFLEESKLANLAAQLGPEGQATWFSRATTGRSKLAGAVGMPFGGSPKIATRVTLPLLELPAKGFQWLQKLSQAKNPGEAAFYTANLKKLGLDDGSIGEGVMAIEPPKPPPSAPSAMAIPESGPVQPAAPAKKTIEFSPQEAFNRRIAAIKYLRETTGDVPAQGELYKFLNDLGEKPVPKAPPKPAPAPREFNGRRPKQDIEFLASAIKGGTPGYPTKIVSIKDAPESFTLHGTEFKRVKSKWDNIITYKDAQGQKHEFRGNEVIHMDPEESPVPF